jgi:hypothetical protein
VPPNGNLSRKKKPMPLMTSSGALTSVTLDNGQFKSTALMTQALYAYIQYASLLLRDENRSGVDSGPKRLTAAR